MTVANIAKLPEFLKRPEPTRIPSAILFTTTSAILFTTTSALLTQHPPISLTGRNLSC